MSLSLLRRLLVEQEIVFEAALVGERTKLCVLVKRNL